MVININNVSNVSKPSPVSPVKTDNNLDGKQGGKVEEQATGQQAKVVDITLSDDITTAFDKISERANTVDMDRVAQLKAQIANGTLNMDLDTIAGNIISTELNE